MTLDADLIAIGVVLWRNSTRHAHGGHKDLRPHDRYRSTPLAETVDTLLETHGIRWADDRLLYQRYEKAIRLKAQGIT